MWDLDEGSFELNEVLAAARMAASLPPEDVAVVVEAVRGLPHAETADLDFLSDTAVAVLEGAKGMYAFDEGYGLANWLRSQKGISGGQGRVDPELLLAAWGVELSSSELRSNVVDAVAC